MSYPIFSDEYFMNEALKQALKAIEQEEVPVGAVVVNQNRIIARAHNMTQQLNDRRYRSHQPPGCQIPE